MITMDTIIKCLLKQNIMVTSYGRCTNVERMFECLRVKLVFTKKMEIKKMFSTFFFTMQCKFFYVEEIQISH